MKRFLYIASFGIILSMIISTISLVSQKNKKYEYGNYPAEYIGTFIHAKDNSGYEYYILAEEKNGISRRLMKMPLDNVVIQNAEKEKIPLSDIHTGDTIKINYNGDIVACYPEIVTKIQSVTLIQKNSDVDVEALLELIPD